LRHAPASPPLFHDDLPALQRDILRKSLQAAAALSEYYTSIESKIPLSRPSLRPLPEERIGEAIELVSSYLRDQRNAISTRPRL